MSSQLNEEVGGQVLLFDILISGDERRCSSDLIIDFGLTRNELRNILDPKDIYGPDCHGETGPAEVKYRQRPRWKVPSMM
jgi:hypothetical protein